MPTANFNYGTFSIGKNTQTAGTAIISVIPPRWGSVGVINGRPVRGRGIIHVTDFSIATGATAHTISVMRPLNYTWFTAVAAAGQAVVNMYDNPGKFSTNYKYGFPPGATPSTADVTLTSGDIVVYQLADGTFFQDTISSLSTLALTLTTNISTGGVVAGGILWYFGAPPTGTSAAPTDPATGIAGQQFLTIASQSPYTLQDNTSLFSTLHDADPLVFSDPNATNADTINLIAGLYGKL